MSDNQDKVQKRSAPKVTSVPLMEREFWQRCDVTGYLNIGRAGLAAWIKDKGFPKGRIVGGRIHYWRRDEVLAWMEEQTEKAA